MTQNYMIIYQQVENKLGNMKNKKKKLKVASEWEQEY